MTNQSKENGSRVVSRRRFTALSAGALTVGLAGCFGDGPNGVDADVAASMPAVWDFSRQVAGEHLEVTDLVPLGEHGHDYDPDPGIVQEIESADAFVYLRDFASWQDDAADSLEDDGDTVVIEATEGIEFFDSPAEDDDEHFWMDPIECKTGVDNIADGLAELDPDNAEEYEANAESFKDELDELDAEFQDILERADEDPEDLHVVVGTHDSFQWWNRRYGFNIHSPIGTSPDDEASAEDRNEVEELMDEHDIEYVLYDVGEPARLAESLAEDTGAEILPLSPVETQIDGSPEVDSSVEMDPDWGYVDHFREINFPTLEKALGAE